MDNAVTTLNLLWMLFQQHAHQLPSKNVRLSCLSKVWGSQSFYHTLILLSSKFLFCRNTVIIIFPLLFWKLYRLSCLSTKNHSLCSYLSTKNHSLCFVWNQNIWNQKKSIVFLKLRSLVNKFEGHSGEYNRIHFCSLVF